jgi:hypothetical protein
MTHKVKLGFELAYLITLLNQQADALLQRLHNSQILSLHETFSWIYHKGN